jgi:hypothetical protein
LWNIRNERIHTLQLLSITNPEVIRLKVSSEVVVGELTEKTFIKTTMITEITTQSITIGSCFYISSESIPVVYVR